jgi:plasmid stabilization system protein ParE
VDYKVRITDSALNDLKGIVLFIAEDDASAAVRVGERLIDRALSLGTMPARCPYHNVLDGQSVDDSVGFLLI